jgi:peroxiredoxin
MRYNFLALILVILINGNIYAQIPAQTLPDFKFSRLDTRPFVNKDLARGKMLVFVFFDSDCEHCQRAVKNIDKQYTSFQKTAVYFISVDDHDKINRFVDTYAPHLEGQKNVVLLRDNLNQFIAKFKPYRYPAMFLYSIDKKLIDYEDNEGSVFRLVNAIKKFVK